MVRKKYLTQVQDILLHYLLYTDNNNKLMQICDKNSSIICSQLGRVGTKDVHNAELTQYKMYDSETVNIKQLRKKHEKS